MKEHLIFILFRILTFLFFSIIVCLLMYIIIYGVVYPNVKKRDTLSYPQEYFLSQGEKIYIVTSSANPIKNLSFKQLRAIYAEELVSWLDLDIMHEYYIDLYAQAFDGQKQKEIERQLNINVLSEVRYVDKQKDWITLFQEKDNFIAYMNEAQIKDLIQSEPSISSLMKVIPITYWSLISWSLDKTPLSFDRSQWMEEINKGEYHTFVWSMPELRELRKLLPELNDWPEYRDNQTFKEHLEENDLSARPHLTLMPYYEWAEWENNPEKSNINMESAEIITLRETQYEWNLTWNFLSQNPIQSGRMGGIFPIILNTIYLIFFTLLFALPLSIATALFLTDYTVRDNIFVFYIRLSINTLAGLPSIIFGLVGFLIFVQYFKLGIGLLSGSLTMIFMILPTLLNVIEYALMNISFSYRAAAFSLGANKVQTVFKVLLPTIVPNLIQACILGIGRIVSETAAILFTLGTGVALITRLDMPSNVLTVHLYTLLQNGISLKNAFTTATVLIILILIINSLSHFFMWKFDAHRK